MIIHGRFPNVSRSMYLESLHHGFRPQPRVWHAIGILDRIDGRAGQQQDGLGQPALFGVNQIQNNVALVQSTGPSDHGGPNAGDVACQYSLGSLPLLPDRVG